MASRASSSTSRQLFWRTWPWFLLAFILALAARQRFQLPQTPISDPDVWCYLNPGLSQLLGHGFQHTFGQVFLYPAFIELLLWLTGDMRSVCLTQHGLGLAGGLFFFFGWARARALFPQARTLAKPFYLGLGLVLTVEEQFSLTIIRFEQTLRPEAVFSFAAALQVWLTIEFIRARWLDKKPNRVLLTGGFVILLAFVLFFLKPGIGLALIPMNLPVALSLFGPALTLRRKILLVTIPTFVVIVFLFAPEARLRRNDPEAIAFLPETLFTVHADLIQKQMTNDLTSEASLPYPREWLIEVYNALQTALTAAARPAAAPYPSLGFNPDYLKSEDSIIRQLRRHWPNDTASLAGFCSFYYWRTVEHQPLGMSHKILRQLQVYYGSRSCPTYGTRKRYPLAAAYETSVIQDAWSREKLNSYPPTQAYLRSYDVLAHSSALPTVSLTEGYLALNRFLSRTYLPLTAVCLFLAILTFGPFAGRFAAFRLAAFLAILLHSYTFGINLTLAITHSLDVGRYVQNQLVFVTLAQGFSAVLLFEVLGTILRVRKLPR